MVFSIIKYPTENHYYDEPITQDDLAIRMMLIPSGSFLMGSPESDLARRDTEGPQHEVLVTQFFMAKYPVTQAQWRRVAVMPQVKRELNTGPSCFQGKLRPVEQVSWLDAVEFCDRLTIATNRQYRLPTEAEWEYACRAETTTPFHFGEILSTDYANYDGNNARSPNIQGKYREQTTPVNKFEGVNKYGLHDMHGNVWEWCQDNRLDNYKSASSMSLSQAITIPEDTSRILRGGSWNSHPSFCRSAFRNEASPTVRSNNIGFRVICSPWRHPALPKNKESKSPDVVDSLTSLASRSRFDEFLLHEWQRLADIKQPISLILCDIDNFRLYNETFGPQAGDRCLIRVSRALLNTGADLVSRHGGEEFAIILSNADTNEAWRSSQKIHDNLRALKISHSPRNEEAYVTISMGVASAIPKSSITAETLVKAADLALRYAKQTGRNRTYVNAHYSTINADEK